MFVMIFWLLASLSALLFFVIFVFFVGLVVAAFYANVIRDGLRELGVSAIALCNRWLNDRIRAVVNRTNGVFADLRTRNQELQDELSAQFHRVDRLQNQLDATKQRLREMDIDRSETRVQLFQAVDERDELRARLEEVSASNQRLRSLRPRVRIAQEQ